VLLADEYVKEMAQMFLDDTLYEPEDTKQFLDAICGFLDAHPIELPKEEQEALEAKKAKQMAEKYPGMELLIDAGMVADID